MLFIGSSRKRKTKVRNFYTAVVLVHPYRYKEKKLEYLLIKRKTEGYNWQGITGSLEKDETTLEGAIRELFEETGYLPSFILPEDFYNGIEGEGEIWEGHYDGKSYIRLDNEALFVARIDQQKNPVINPEEHTDWSWSSFEKAYDLIRWDLEKRLLRYINKMLLDGKIKEE